MLKRKSKLAMEEKPWPGWTHRDIETDATEVKRVNQHLQMMRDEGEREGERGRGKKKVGRGIGRGRESVCVHNYIYMY